MVRAIETKSMHYGYRPSFGTMLILQTDDGHLIKWSSSSTRSEDVGDEVVITGGTVKEHAEYRGDDQTVITRAKIEKPNEVKPSQTAHHSGHEQRQHTRTGRRLQRLWRPRVSFTVVKTDSNFRFSGLFDNIGVDLDEAEVEVLISILASGIDCYLD